MTRVGFRADAGPGIGVGHLMRCLALAEEFVARGVEVVMLGDLGGLAWAERQVSARGLTLLAAPPDLVLAVGELALDAVVLDSYSLDPACSAALRRAGVPVLAIVDGDARGQDADLYLDQNLGAEAEDARWMCGPSYVLLRNDVRALGRPTAGAGRTPEVLCFFGGTDAGGAAPVAARLLADSGVPHTATIVTSSPLPPHIRTIAPTDDLPKLAVASDLVVTACGSAVWEMLHLAVPMALVWVAENQRASYQRIVDAGLAVGLGHIDDVRANPSAAVGALRPLLSDPRFRTALAARGSSVIDGKGRERVADAVLALRSHPK